MDKKDITAMNFIDLSKEDRLDILDRVSSELNIRQREVIEKDWWVTAVLRAMFGLPYADHLSFKGGTSLSKCWHLIDRFPRILMLLLIGSILVLQEPYPRRKSVTNCVVQPVLL